MYRTMIGEPGILWKRSESVRKADERIDRRGMSGGGISVDVDVIEFGIIIGFVFVCRMSGKHSSERRNTWRE